MKGQWHPQRQLMLLLQYYGYSVGVDALWQFLGDERIGAECSCTLAQSVQITTSRGKRSQSFTLSLSVFYSSRLKKVQIFCILDCCYAKIKDVGLVEYGSVPIILKSVEEKGVELCFLSQKAISHDGLPKALSKSKIREVRKSETKTEAATQSSVHCNKCQIVTQLLPLLSAFSAPLQFLAGKSQPTLPSPTYSSPLE